ncbi:MAG: glycosyltransferase family 2 protein [Chloroflexia bacterium]|nr:glycosyltransferase family 2 protein [Chloroflexia bacterium]
MTNLSIVIPTYNRLARLKDVLAALEHQTYPLDAAEVIVVSDGSTDGTHEYLSDLQSPLNLRFVTQTNAGPAVARNTGINTAQGNYILFIDDDVVPTPQMVGEHMKHHATRPNLVVLGPMLSPPDFKLSPWVNWEQAMLEKQYKAMQSGEWTPTARQFYTGNTSLARRYLVETGGFDERFRRAEDIELAYRLYNRLIRILIQGCVGRLHLSRSIQSVLHHIAGQSSRLGLTRFYQASYSAIFNLRYYQGIADDLGGRTELLTMLKTNTAPVTVQE